MESFAMALGAVAVALSVGLMVALFIGWKRRRAVRRVERYQISVEKHDGFAFVHLRLAEDNGSYSTYELEPEYTHVLSDELLQASAMALRPEAHAPAR